MKFLPLLKRGLFFSFFALTLIFTMISCQNDLIKPKDSTNIISGTITDQQNMSVPNAIVQVVANDKVKMGAKIMDEKIIVADTTDEDGNFTLPNLPVDISNMNFRVLHTDFQKYEVSLQDLIANKDRKKVPVKLLNDSACKGRIEIIVKNKKDSTVINEAEVRMNRSGTIIRKSWTNADGKIIFENVCSGRYWIRIARPHFKVLETDDGFTIEGDNTITRTLYLEPEVADTCCNGVIKIIVKDAGNGQILNGVVVKLWKDAKLIASRQTENTSATFTGICKGTYGFSIWKNGYIGSEWQFEIGCNDTLLVDRTILQDSCCNGKLLVTLKDTNGAPLPGTTINLSKYGNKIGSVKTDGNGQYLFTGMCDGAYVLNTSRDGFKPTEFAVTVPCNDSVYIDKTLYVIEKDTCCNGVIKVWVRDASGKVNLNGATVKMWFNGAIMQTETVVEGYAIFKGLCSGKYGFDITKDTYIHQEFNVELPCNQTVLVEKFLVSETTEDTCCQGKIRLFVRKINSDLNLNGAIVKISKNGTLLGSQTVAEGSVLFQQLCMGTYNFRISLDGYKVIEFALELACNQVRELEKYLEPVSTDSCCNGQIKIVARDSKSNEPLNGATVKIWKNGTLLSTGTVANGYYLFTKLCDASYAFDILAEHHKHIEFNYTLSCNEQKVIEKTLEPEVTDSCCFGKYTVVIQDSTSGNPVGGVTVNLWKGSTKLAYRTTAADAGSITFSNLCQGEYSISVSRDGYNGREWSFAIGCSETLRVEKKILAKSGTDTCCTAVLKIRVIDDADGSYISGARVVVRKNGVAIADPSTNVEGWIMVQNLCAPATYSYLVSKDGYISQDGSATFTTCVTQALSVRLKK